MKKLVFKFLTIMVAAVLSSCSTSGTYYQLVNTKPTGNLKKTDNAVVFEDANCKISYDLWSKGGSTCIRFENKTDEDIYLDLAATFYFMNDQAFDLYDGAATSKSITTSNQHQIITIPAKMYKIIGETEVAILEGIYRDCNLYLAPSKKAINSTSFTQSDSPFTFGLRLSYYVGKSGEPIRVKNVFYVDKITNYPSCMFKENYQDKSSYCPDERGTGKPAVKYFFSAPDAFYLEYHPQTMNDGSVIQKKH